jgi:hypothetical protein
MKDNDLYLFQDRAFHDTLPHGVELPTLVGQPASLSGALEDIIGPFRPQPKPRRRPGWSVVLTFSLLALALGYLAGLAAASFL